MKFVRTFVLLAAAATAAVLAPFAAAQAPDTTPPTLVRGEIDGTIMTLYFNEALDGTSVPAARAFRTTVRFPGGGLNCWAKGPVQVSGNKVVVGGIRRAIPGYRAWFYSYDTSLAVNKLRDLDGNEVRDIPPILMELSNISTPAVRLVEVSGTVVTMTFYTQLDMSSKPAASAFTVTVDGSAATLATTDPVEFDGAKLKLNLASAVASGASVTVSYTKPVSNPLQDPAGNQVKNYQVDGIAGRTVNPDCGKWGSPFQAASFQAAGFQAAGFQAAGIVRRASAPLCLPKATEVEVSSEPVDAATYAQGETIRVRLTFSEAVTVTGTPRVKLDFSSADGDEQWADYASGSGSSSLEFAYTVTQRDASSAGVAVLANSLELNGGTIKSVSNAEENATLAHAGLAPDRNHKVDGGHRPTLSAVAVVSDAGDDATYAAGDTVQVALTFGGAVAVVTEGGTPRLKLDLGGDDGTGERWAAYESGSGTATLTFAWQATAPDESPVGVAVLADTLELAGGAIRSVATQAAAVRAAALKRGGGATRSVATQAAAAFGHAGLAHDPAHKVDAVAPRLLRGEIDGATVTLTFSEALDPDSTGGRFLMGIQTSETASLGCFATGAVSVDGATATVGLGRGCPPAQAGLTARNYVKYLRHAEGHDGSFRDLAGNLLTPDGDAGIGLYVQIDLENVTGKTAAVTGAEVVTDAGADGAYAVGGTVEAAVTFDAPVTVGTEGGAPTLALIANGGTRLASYASGSGTERLAFAWRVGEADGSVAAPVRVAASGLKLNGGSIASAAGKPASLGFGEAPGVTAVSVATRDDGSWEAGETVEATLTFAEPVAVEGAPSVGLVLEGASRRAVYAAGSGTDVLAFRYTLGEGDGPWARAALAGNSLRLGGGSISSAGGGLAAVLGHGGTGASGEAADPPAVTGVTVASDAGSDATYGLGERIRVRVAFSEAVAVTGSPGIAIDMDPAEWGEKRAVYESGSGTDALVFVHEVVEPNLSRQGIAVLADSLALHGGATIRSAATQTDAALGHSGSDHDPAHKVDWRLASATEASVTAASATGPPSVTGVEVVSDAGSDDTYLLGDTIRVRLAFSEAVRVTGAPRLSIDMDPAQWGEKRAAFEGARDTAALALTFAWTVVEPNWSPRGIAVLANSLVLGGGTIVSAATGEAAALGHAGRDHDPAHKVDWRPALSVADARAREGVDEAVVFEVSLGRAFTTAEHRVTVDYATADGTATADEDYTATSGTLTFVAGETTKTVSVPVLDDSHDEGHETLVLRLSNVQGARRGDLEATGTIENIDPMPRAWLARFGRTLAEQVVDAVGARLAAPRGGGAQARVAGQDLAAGGIDADGAARLADQELARWLAGTPEQPRTISGGELLAGSAFAVTSAAAEDGPSAALWGRGGWSRFEGREGSLSVDGEVTTALLGAEAASGAWLGGVMLSHARGDGSYRGDAGAGTVASTLTAVHPYVGVDLSERLTAWAAGGLGLGGLTLTPEGAGALETDLSLLLAALGARGRLVEPAAGSGFSLAIETDAYWVRTGSAAASGLAETQADATRIRLGLDGGYRLALAGGGTLEPTVEVGVRHDGGHAETGYGMDLGGGLAWSDPALGLSAQVAARGLLTGAFDGFRDLGLSGSLAWDSDPASDRGPSLTVTQTVGAAATGGRQALLGRSTLAGLAATGDGLDSRRLELKFGYGFPVFGERFTATPEFGVALSDTAREVRLGWKLGLARSGTSSFELGVEATRTEPANDSGPEHGIRLKLDARF